VDLRVHVLNIDRIDTVNMMFALTMEVDLRWQDPRIRFKNLKKGLGQNKLNRKERKSIWKPTVHYTNAKIGQLKDDYLGIMVQKESGPLPFTYQSHIEGKRNKKANLFQIRKIWGFFLDKIFPGSNNSLVLAKKVYAEYGCT